MGIKNLGRATCDEIVRFRDDVGHQYQDILEPYCIRTIAEENKPIPIGLLQNVGVSIQQIKHLLGQELTTLGDLHLHSLPPQRYSVGRIIEGYMAVPISQQFSEKIQKLRDTERDVLIGRVAGFTLEEIGQELGITRERVRQLLLRVNSKLLPTAELVAGAILSADGVAFPVSALEGFFRDKGLAECCTLILRSSKYLRCLEFCGKFARTTVYRQNMETEVHELLARIIGNGINFYDNLDVLQSELAKLRLGFLSIEDLMNLMLSNNYRFYGDFVVKGHQPYAVVCYDAVVKFFGFKIKLNGDSDNEDMTRLRQVIARHYAGLTLPTNNRALTAGLTRDYTKLILAGRSYYCPIDKVIYSESLFEDIIGLISQTEQTSFYYAEIFEHFKGRLLAETNIDNHQFLHGMLRYLYPTEFKYERDLMYKVGEAREGVDDRLSVLLLQKGSAITLDEVKRAMPGIKNYTVAFSAIRLPRVIQWDYNEYNHMDNIKVTEHEKVMIKNSINNAAQVYKGYLSESMLFNIVRGSYVDFLRRNSIRNSQNLYYVVAYIFANSFRFRRPHILLNSFPVEQITSANIVEVLLGCEYELNYGAFVNLTDKLGWSDGTRYSVFSEMVKDYIRITENRYVKKSHFVIPAPILHLLSSHLETYMGSGYFALGNIIDFDPFPKCSYGWNSFLLESVILEYQTGYRLLSPQIRDRRYHREIIVRSCSPYNTFEDLVLAVLRSDKISNLPEREFIQYLKRRGLIVTSAIPQELYRCPSIAFRNGKFYFD